MHIFFIIVKNVLFDFYNQYNISAHKYMYVHLVLQQLYQSYA